MEDVLIIAVSWLISAVIAALVGHYTGVLRSYELQTDMAETRRLIMGLRSEKGNSAQAQDKEDMEAAMLEAAQILQANLKPDEQKAALAQLIQKYPRVALKMAKKIGFRL